MVWVLGGVRKWNWSLLTPCVPACPLRGAVVYADKELTPLPPQMRELFREDWLRPLAFATANGASAFFRTFF